MGEPKRELRPRGHITIGRGGGTKVCAGGGRKRLTCYRCSGSGGRPVRGGKAGSGGIKDGTAIKGA